MNIVRITVPNPDELLNTAAFGAAAKVRLESSPDNSAWTEESTQTIVTATTIYTFYDADGTSATYYRSRYSNTGGSSFSDYSDVWQVTSAPVEYTTLHAIKNRTEIPDTEDDSILETIAGEVNDWLEGRIGFPVGPIASEERLFDGSRVRYADGGTYLNCYPFGVRTVTVAKTASGTGQTLTTQTLADVVVRPHAFERESGWPGFELHVKDSASWTWNSAGFDVNAITATWGWAVVPRELSSIATRVAIARLRGRGAGSGQTFSIGDDIESIAAEELSSSDWKTIFKYANLKAMIG